MDRRSFLKGLLTSTALVALPLPMIFARGGIVKTTSYVIFADLPLCQFGNRIPMYAGCGIGQWLGSQIFPEAPLDKNQKGPRLKRNKDGTLWVIAEHRPEERLHP